MFQKKSKKLLSLVLVLVFSIFLGVLPSSALGLVKREVTDIKAEFVEKDLVPGWDWVGRFWNPLSSKWLRVTYTIKIKVAGTLVNTTTRSFAIPALPMLTDRAKSTIKNVLGNILRVPGEVIDFIIKAELIPTPHTGS